MEQVGELKNESPNTLWKENLGDLIGFLGWGGSRFSNDVTEKIHIK